MLAPPLSHLPGMVFRCRLDQKRTLLFASDGCRQVTGYEPAELVSNEAVAYGELIYERDRAMVEETIAAAYRERRPYQISYRIQTRVGEEKWVWEQGSGIFSTTGSGAIVIEGIIVDITPRRFGVKPVESEQRKEAVGQLASGIAHDFKNIMSVIVLYCELLERQPEHPRRQHYLSVINKQANHASRLISQLLDYSRHSPVEGQVLELNAFLEEMANLLERTLPEAVTLVLESRVRDAVVEADSTRLQQVLLNLVLNAKDAMPEGGTLAITLSRFELAPGEKRPAAFARRGLPGLDEGKWVRIEVTDSGTGIPPDVLPHIFEPFFTTKEAGTGTGLGLAQVDGIMEQLGGTVGVDSRVGEGTTFTLYFRLVESGRQMLRKGERALAAIQPEQRILLVESSAETREALSDAVRSLGYQVLTADSGSEAVALFHSQKQAFDLLVTSAQTRDMKGDELCRSVRRTQPDLPCLMLGSASQHYLREKNTFWIQKPFSLRALAENLRLALGR